jgi:glycine dehydrogenase subunit 1
MSNPYIQATTDQVEEMLEVIGASSIDELFETQVPLEFHLRRDLGLPPALSELEIQQELGELAARNSSCATHVCFAGGGIYDHFVPSAIMAVAGRSEFVTGYTPYQPEVSQGTLQAFFEYQTMVSRLYGMPVSNASLYDGATALGEALLLALNARDGANTVLLPQALHPDYRALVETYLSELGVEIKPIPLAPDGKTDTQALKKLVSEQVAAVVVQHPNYLGCLEDTADFVSAAQSVDALTVAVADPLSLALLTPPGEWGADIAVGEGQALGLNPYAGGETLGLFTCKQEFMRRIPGRLVGMAQDRNNKRGFVLTLQTREQHIRRGKATSNICTNHAHNALRATIHLCLMGPQGMQRAATACVRGTQRLKKTLISRKPSAVPFSAPVFKEFVVQLACPAREAIDALHKRGFIGGVDLEPALGSDFRNALLVAVTEKRTDQQIDRFAAALGEYL